MCFDESFCISIKGSTIKENNLIYPHDDEDEDNDSSQVSVPQSEFENSIRHELLSMVKKHFYLIGKTAVDEQDASHVEMDQKFWLDVLDQFLLVGGS
ncbi:hypothetical protein Tco_0174925 [Tanacetum coccineum]